MITVMVVEALLKVIPRGRFRERLVALGRSITTSDAFFPLVVWYFSSQIQRVNKHPRPEIGILLLDFPRWWKEDLKLLETRAQLFVLPDEARAHMLALFLTYPDMRALLNYTFDDQGRQRKESLVAYLRRLIPALAARRGFHCIVTTNHMYLQNKPLAETCSRTTVPFIDLHKENMKDASSAEGYIQKYRAIGMNLNFMGNKICVYNKFMKDLFLQLDVASPDQIEVTGAMRIDAFARRIHDQAKSTPRNTVTLFSFRHLPAGANPADYVYQFSPDGSHGYARLFDAVHGVFAELAAAHPQIHFVVKMKWAEYWADYVRKAIEKAGLRPSDLPNLRIVGVEESAQELILQSRAVVGLNSTTLLEARLAGRPVVLPYFEEIADRYPETLVFRDVMPEFIVARSREEFKNVLTDLIRAPRPDKPLAARFVEQYFGWNDGKSLDRVLGVLKDASAQASRKLRTPPSRGA